MAAAPAHCNDRVNHPTLVGPCHANRINCVEHAHAAPFSVCNTCINDTVHNRLFNRAPNPHSRWERLAQLATPRMPRNMHHHVISPLRRGFWTSLCDECIYHEEKLWWRRRVGTEPPADRIPNAQRAFAGYPDATCTCYQKLQRMSQDGNGAPYRHCYDCRLQLYNRLFQRRTANEQWLENTERVPNTPRTARAGLRTRTKRDAAGFYRACRCGNNISGNPPAARDIMMCLACEGVLIINPPLAPPAPPPGRYRPFGRRIDLQRPRLDRNADQIG